MVLLAALAVDGEVPARRRLQSPFARVGLQRQLGHELRVAVHVVGVERRLVRELLAEVDLLIRVRLREVRIHTARGRVDDLLDTRRAAGEEERAVQCEVARARRLVQVDVAAASVVGGQVEDEADVLDRALSHTGAPEIVLDELDRALVDVVLDVLELAAAEVVDHADGGAAGDELLHEGRADERRAARDERRSPAPFVRSRHGREA